MSAAENLALRRRIRVLMDTVDEHREQWLNKQIELEQMERRLDAVSSALRDRDRGD